MNASSILSEIATKVTKLKLRNDRLEKENEELRNSVFNYLKELDLQKNEITHLQEQLSNNKTHSRLASEKKNLQKELDKYISLIDKSIESIQQNIG
jgi:nitrate/nitrite-specific signal transduction histidine kinase